MVLGDPRVGWVTTDSSGVPTGGIHGNVARFEKKLGEHGLKLAWVRGMGFFYVYTVHGRQYIPQWPCWDHNTDGPAMLNDELLWLLIHYWENHSRHTVATIGQAISQAQADFNRRAAKQQYEENAARVKEATGKTLMNFGITSPRIYSLPKRIILPN